MPGAPSLLQSVMSAFEAETGMRMSFDDFSGAHTGVHMDVAALKLDWSHQVHACSFCEFAKQDEQGGMDCVVNKLAVNRLVSRRRTAIEGFCHLGLFDMAEPVIYQGRVLGIFYYGSVVVRGQEALTRGRILRYCVRRGIDPEGHFAALAEVPLIEPERIPQYREALRTVARLATHFCEAAGVRPEAYRNRELKFPYLDPQDTPYVVKAAIQFINAHIEQPFIVKDLAAHLNCHPDFLSRKFKQHTGLELSIYIQHARVDRAKKLMENPKLDIGMAAEQSGFSDRVHFGKVFRRVTGVTPGTYLRQLTANAG